LDRERLNDALCCESFDHVGLNAQVCESHCGVSPVVDGEVRWRRVVWRIKDQFSRRSRPRGAIA
jgi:hypothetical protein